MSRSDELVASDLGRPASYYNGATLLRPPDPADWGNVIDGLPSVALFNGMSCPGAERRGYWPITRFTLWRHPRP